MRPRPLRLRFSPSQRLAFLGHATTNWHRAAAIGACLAAGGLLACAADAWWREHGIRLHEREALQARRAELERRLPVRVAARPPPRTFAETARHNVAVRQLNIPWSDILDGLERHADADVGLTAVEPDAATGMLRIQAEARHIDALFAHAQQLSSDLAFGSLVLHQHETNELDPNRPARLSFEVRFAAPDLVVNP